MKRATDQFSPLGPVLALDLGQKLVGAAISDERLITTKRLPPLKRSNWKKLLQDVRHLVERFDAQMIVVGLPLRLDGTAGDAARDAGRRGPDADPAEAGRGLRGPADGSARPPRGARLVCALHPAAR